MKALSSSIFYPYSLLTVHFVHHRFAIWSPLLPCLQIRVGEEDEPETADEDAVVAQSQKKVPKIKYWGVSLRKWPRILIRPPALGKHHAKTTLRDHSGNKSYTKPHLYSHTPEQIAAAILSPVSRTEARSKAVKRYRELRSRPGQNPEDPELLFKYFKVFNHMFFLGALDGLCYIKIVKVHKNSLGDCCTAGTDWIFGFHIPL